MLDAAGTTPIRIFPLKVGITSAALGLNGTLGRATGAVSWSAQAVNRTAVRHGKRAPGRKVRDDRCTRASSEGADRIGRGGPKYGN